MNKHNEEPRSQVGRAAGEVASEVLDGGPDDGVGHHRHHQDDLRDRRMEIDADRDHDAEQHEEHGDRRAVVQQDCSRPAIDAQTATRADPWRPSPPDRGAPGGSGPRRRPPGRQDQPHRRPERTGHALTQGPGGDERCVAAGSRPQEHGQHGMNSTAPGPPPRGVPAPGKEAAETFTEPPHGPRPHDGERQRGLARPAPQIPTRGGMLTRRSRW